MSSITFSTLNTIMKTTASKYIKAGLSVIPVNEKKKPTLSTWKPYQTRRASDNEINTMFSGAGVSGIAVICGEISGGLEALDFDSGGAVYPDWKEKIPPELFRKLTVEKSPHGYHVYFRSNAVEGNAKLANAENNSVLIETRGTGGYCICDPTAGYSLIQGSMLDVKTITPEEREKLMEAAREFNQVKKQRPQKPAPQKEYRGQDFSPADYISTYGDIRAILERNGWTSDRFGADGNEHWTRPGKAGGTSATLKENESGVLLFYPFTTSTEFEAGKGYNAFQVLSILEYGGNESDAARAIREQVDQGRRAAVPLKQGAPVHGSDWNGTEIEIDITDTGEIEPHRDRESFVSFPLEALPLITRNYVTDTARALNVDPSIVAVATLNTAGALIGARLKLRLGGYDWTAPAILWTAIIGASSMGKTPAMKAPLTLLSDRERELEQRHAKEMENYNRKNGLHKRVLSKIDKYNETAIDKEEEGDKEAAGTFRQKAENLEQSPNFKPPQKPAERVLKISGDFTLQGLIGIAAENPMGFQLYLDELTQLFTSLSNSSDKAAAQEFLKFFDGTPSRTGYKNAEKNRQASQCWASVLGGAIPSILQGYLKGTQYERDGLLSRFCLVWAPPVPPEQYNPRAEITEGQKAPMKKIMEALVDFRPDYIDTNEEEKTDSHIDEMYKTPQSRYCRLSLKATEEFNKKRADLYCKKYDTSQEAQISLLGKSDGVLGRIALILHVLNAAEKLIDETQLTGLENYTETHEVSLETYRRAEQITEWLVKETETVYKKLGILADDNDLLFIVDRLKKCSDGASTVTIQYWKSQWRDKGKPILERLLEIGIKKGLLTATVQTGRNNKPCRIYKVNEK